jgi:polygalacturonase
MIRIGNVLRFKSTRGRGGIVENIYISDIDMINIPTDVINFNLFYGGNSPVLEAEQSADREKRDETLFPVTEKTPAFRNIFMKNITATGSGQAANFQGLPEMNLQNVRLENSFFEAQKGIIAVDTDGLELVNVQVISATDAALTLYNSKNIGVKGLTFVENGQVPIRVLGEKSKNITFQKSDFSTLETEIYQGAELPKYAVKIQ